MAYLLEEHGSWALKIRSNVDVRNGGPLKTGRKGSHGRQPMPLGKNGQALRKQQSITLCRVNDTDCKTKTSSKVLELAAEAIKKVEAWEAAVAAGELHVEAPSGDTRVCDFYRGIFIPSLKKLVETGQMAAATLKTYEAYWDGFLGEHFNGTKTLKNYRAYMGRDFLEFLRKEEGTPYGENTIKKIHSCASGIFTDAVEREYIDHNPWKDIKRDKLPAKSAEEGVAYTEAQVEAMISNLEADLSNERIADKVQAAQVALALGIWAGLRPSEICGLKWENCDTDQGTLAIKKAVVYGVEKGTKTDVERIVTVLSPAIPILRRWKKTCGDPTTGWVLQNRNGDPINMNDISSRIIGPNCERNGMGDLWKGNSFYAGRRAFGTLLKLHGADCDGIAQAMGNTPSVVWKYYFKDKKGMLAATAAEKYEQNKRGRLADGMAGESRRLAARKALTGGAQ